MTRFLVACLAGATAIAATLAVLAAPFVTARAAFRAYVFTFG